MKSRIIIDINESNEPIIKIQYEASEDVRDKMVKRFLQKFGGDSSYAYFAYSDEGVTNSTAVIKPISPDKLEEESKVMVQYIEHMKKR